MRGYRHRHLIYELRMQSQKLELELQLDLVNLDHERRRARSSTVMCPMLGSARICRAIAGAAPLMSPWRDVLVRSLTSLFS